MKKIINAKMYDTETAKNVGSWNNGYPSSDFNYICETLYQKRTGEFFLYGIGGANTKYSSLTSYDWSGGSEIVPMSYEDARDFAEKYLDADTYEKIFGEVAEDDSKIAICISISAETAEKVKRAAAMNGKTISEYIEMKLKGDI